jgi:hypothetical protein
MYRLMRHVIGVTETTASCSGVGRSGWIRPPAILYGATMTFPSSESAKVLKRMTLDTIARSAGSREPRHWARGVNRHSIESNP